MALAGNGLSFTYEKAPLAKLIRRSDSPQKQ